MGLFCSVKSELKKQKKEEEKVVLQILLDFAEGRISTEDFWGIYKSNDAVRSVLIKDKMRYSISVWNSNRSKFETKYNRRLKEPSDLIFDLNPDNLLEKLNIMKLQHKYELFVIVNRFFLARGIEIEKFNNDVSFYFYLSNLMPDWVRVNDVEYLEKIFDSVPNELKKKEKTAWCKNRIKELFRYDDKPPDWIQEPDWPIVNNVPYVFSHQETAEEGFEMYYFYNPKDNTEKVIIEQCE